MSDIKKLGPVSAYAIAVEHGFEGTEAQWLASLHPSEQEILASTTEYFRLHPASRIGDGAVSEVKLADGAVTEDKLGADVKAALAGMDDKIDGALTDLTGLLDKVGGPLVAATVAGMTDNTKIYVYTGSEDGYTAGNWYYWNGSAWVSGGTYQSDGLTTDIFLASAGAAADGKAAGQKVRGLSDALAGEDVVASSTDWEQGGLSSSSGGHTTSNTRIRTEAYLPSAKLQRLSCATGYKCMVFVYTSKNYTDYQGVWNGAGGLAAEACWLRGVNWMQGLSRDVYYRVILAKEDDADLLPAAGSNLTRYTSPTGLGGKPFGTRVGDLEDEIQRYNAMPVQTGLPQTVSEDTKSGFTYSIDGGVFSVTGPNEGETPSNFSLILEGSSSKIPGWVEADRTFFVRLNISDPWIRFQIEKVKTEAAGGGSEFLFSGVASGPVTFGDLEDTEGIILRYSIQKNAVFEEAGTAAVEIWTGPTPAEIWQRADDNVTPVSLRVMQYNIGGFIQGYKDVGELANYRRNYPNDTKQIVTPENYQEKLLNLKRFFGKYRPDVVGLQEYEKYMLRYIDNGEEVDEHNASEELFEDLFAYQSSPRESTYRLRILSNREIIYKKTCYAQGDSTVGHGVVYRKEHPDDPDTETAVGASFRRVTLNVNGRKVVVVSTALMTDSLTKCPGYERGVSWPSTVQRLAWSQQWSYQRRAELTDMLEQLASAENVIILLDTNCTLVYSEPDDTLQSWSSMLRVFDVLDEYGYTAAHGLRYVTDGNTNVLTPFYWPMTKSYVPHVNGAPGMEGVRSFRPIDNIFVKGNIKIRNFEVLTDEYDGLVSDHIPVIADLDIW